MLWKCSTKVGSKLPAHTLRRNDLFLFKIFERGILTISVWKWMLLQFHPHRLCGAYIKHWRRQNPNQKLPIEALYYWIFSVIKYLLLLCRLAFCNLFLQSEDYPLLRTFLQTFSTFWYLVHFRWLLPYHSHFVVVIIFVMLDDIYFFSRFAVGRVLFLLSVCII